MPHKKARQPYQAHRLLRSAGLKPKKSLGQNFLTDNNIRDSILSAARLSKDDVVIEVGPGLGVLTEELAKKAGRVVAVELDDSLSQRLAAKMGPYANVEVINDDILKVDLTSILMSGSYYKVVANIPYYITSPILNFFLQTDLAPLLMIIMMQKEVAQDITAPPGKLNYLSVSMRMFSDPEIVCHVPASCFYPPPRVDSAVVRFNVLSEPAVTVDNVDRFLEFVHQGFGAPRKKMRNSLAIGLKIEPAQADKILGEANIDAERRPGTLSLNDWAALYKKAGRKE